MADFSPVELLELFQRAQNQFTDRVDAVEPGPVGRRVAARLDRRGPGRPPGDRARCGCRRCWPGSPTLEGRFPDATDDLLGDDPFTGWETAADGALSAFAEDDALVRTVHLTRGADAGDRVHPRDDRRPDRARLGPRRARPAATPSWTASWSPPALVFAERLPEDGVPGLFDPPLDVSASAPPQARLLARLRPHGR